MADDHLDNFLAACRTRRGNDVTSELRQATSRFVAAAAAAPTLLSGATAALAGLSGTAAAWLGLTLGSSMETGSEVALTGTALLAYFQSRLPLLPYASDGKTEGEQTFSQQQLALLKVFDEICTAVVAHLARMPAPREALAGDQE